MQFELLADNVLLSQVFGQLEDRKAELNVEDYSISQTTLDSIFLGFAKQQRGNDTATDDCEDKAKTWRRARIQYRVDGETVQIYHPSDDVSMT
jgi:hypothetical protein